MIQLPYLAPLSSLKRHKQGLLSWFGVQFEASYQTELKGLRSAVNTYPSRFLYETESELLGFLLASVPCSE